MEYYKDKRPFIEGEVWKFAFNKKVVKVYVSNLGRVKSIRDDGRVVIYSQVFTSHGYLTASRRVVHRLVGFAFLNGYKEDYQINHIDGNKLNNCCNNLEWVSAEQNIQHALDTGLVKRTPVVAYTLTGEFVAEYPSISKAIKANNSSVHMCITGSSMTTNGLLFFEKRLFTEDSITSALNKIKESKENKSITYPPAPNRKLTMEQAEWCRDNRENYSRNAMSRMLGVSKKIIRDILAFKYYKS